MGKWGTIRKYLAKVGLAAGEAAVEKATGGFIPGSVLDQRAKFQQWPPAPSEVTPGVGGGTSPGLTPALIESLGNLWMAIPGHPAQYPDTAADNAASYVAEVYGWGEILLARQLDPDQFYVARMYLRKWVEDGKEPAHMRPAAGMGGTETDANAREAEYQAAVRAAGRLMETGVQSPAQAPAPAPVTPTPTDTRVIVAYSCGHSVSFYVYIGANFSALCGVCGVGVSVGISRPATQG
jgi:hypothetical protein